MNIRKDILVNASNLTNPSGTIEVSLVSGASVFDGQQIYLTVTVKSSNYQEIIHKINNIKIESVSNSVSYITYENFKGIDLGVGQISYGSAIILLTIKSTGSVTFKVIAEGLSDQAVPGVDTPTITYNSQSSDSKETITLSTENEFISTPIVANPISDGKYNLYSGGVFEGNGGVIKNTQITVAAQKLGQLFPALINITDNNGQLITIIDEHSERPFFVLNSDGNGEISFRAYPIQGQSARIDFVSQISNITPEIFTAVMCIYPDSSGHRTLDDPFIDGLEIGGILRKPSGETSFHTTINPYPNANSEDVLAFFTEYVGEDKKILLSPTYRAGNNVNNMSFPFTYDQLEPEKLGKLYYAVISESGSIRYSHSLRIEYMDDPYSPGNNKNRIYDKVTVYSNINNNPKPSDTNGIVKEGVTINFDTISNGVGISGEINNGKPGLFVIIEFTKDQSNENLPKVGKKGYLTVSITGKKDILITFDTQKSTPETDGSILYISCPIPFCSLTWIGENIESKLKISYTITNSDSGKIKSSKVWETNIDTIVVGEDPSVNYGCYNILS